MTILSRVAILSIMLLSLLGSAACTDDQSVNSNSNLTGTAFGWISVYAYDTNITDYSGVTVTFEGTNFKAVTDKLGRWEIDGVPTRTYTITYSKQGFGTHKTFGFIFVGGGIIEAPGVTIRRFPSCGLVFDDMREAPAGVLEAFAHPLCLTEQQQSFVAFFFSNTPNVSSESYQVAKVMWTTPQRPATVTLSKLEAQDWISLNPGDSIYAVAYHASGDSYYDPIADKMIYTGLYPEVSRVLAILLKK